MSWAMCSLGFKGQRAYGVAMSEVAMSEDFQDETSPRAAKRLSRSSTAMAEALGPT